MLFSSCRNNERAVWPGDLSHADGAVCSLEGSLGKESRHPFYPSQVNCTFSIKGTNQSHFFSLLLQLLLCREEFLPWISQPRSQLIYVVPRVYGNRESEICIANSICLILVNKPIAGVGTRCVKDRGIKLETCTLSI